MQRFFSLIMFLIIAAGAFCASAEAYTIEGSVSYTVERARKEAFANVEYTIPQEIIDSNLVDPNFKANKKAMKDGVVEPPDRWITKFSDGGYGIVYKNNRYFEFEYSQNGKLKLIGKRDKLVCPIKTYKYNIKNELNEIAIYITMEEAYTFRPDGQMKSHWIGNKGYDINGKLILESY